MSQDEPVAGIGEESKTTGRHSRRQQVGLGWWDRLVYFTLEDPHVRADLHQRKTPRPSLENTIPRVGVDALPNGFPNGIQEQSSTICVLQQPLVRFWTGQVKEPLGSVGQPTSRLSDRFCGLVGVMPRQPVQSIVVRDRIGFRMGSDTADQSDRLTRAGFWKAHASAYGPPEE